MQQNTSNSQKMGTMPIGRLLANMSIPAIFSMLVQSLYNVVDSIFVSQIGENALTAVSLAFPLQMLIIAFSIGLGVGCNSLIARRLGEHNIKAASTIASTGVFLAIINAIVFMLIGLFGSHFFMNMFSTDAEVVQMGTQYLTIIMVFSFGVFVEITCSRILQATGNMMIPMTSQLIGAITNIILDPILIFGLFGFPKLGITGAAIATVIGQICSMTFVIIMLKVKSHDVHIKLRGFKPKKQSIIEIYQVGAPSICMNALGSITITGINAILMTFSATAVAIMGIYFKLQSFIFMPVFGLTQGAMPIMAYNFGAGNKKRFMHTLYLSFAVSFTIMVFGTVIFWCFPAQLLGLFNGSTELVNLGIYVLRVLSLCFIPASFGIIIATMFQAMGHGFNSLIMSLLRQMVFLLPCAWIFGKLFGLDGVWFCYPVSEFASFLIFTPIAFMVVKKSFNQEEDKPISKV
ncbi:MAG: MATE family efflux transporter [Cellulosilyticaceae bacterium]